MFSARVRLAGTGCRSPGGETKLVCGGGAFAGGGQPPIEGVGGGLGAGRASHHVAHVMKRCHTLRPEIAIDVSEGALVSLLQYLMELFHFAAQPQRLALQPS